MIRLVYGTGNAAKLEGMKRLLQGAEIEIVGLNEFGPLSIDIDESGNDPLENARIKARAYFDALKMPVFSCDSGLYLYGLPDSEQPGVHVRRVHGKVLNDDEMIVYYSGLAEKAGGRLKARYMNAVCLMTEEGCFEHSGADISGDEFYLATAPHPSLTPGFPLDSLSVHIPTGLYYNDLEGYKLLSDAMAEGFKRFFSASLGYRSRSAESDNERYSLTPQALM